MVTEAVISKSLIAAINLCVDNRLGTYNFVSFAKVITVNQNLTINVQPLGSQRVTTLLGTHTYKPYPLIQNVPYLMLNYPRIGDYCVLLHLDKQIDGGAKNIVSGILDAVGTPIRYIKGTTKPHALDNCVAICGFKNISEDLTSTALDNVSLKHQVYEIGNLLYPVGSIYMNMSGTATPAELFGGTWIQISDVVLAGAGTTNTNYIGTSGGAKQHNHSVTPTTTAVQAGGGTAAQTVVLGDADNIPPYKTVYIWQRETLAAIGA